MTYPIGTPGVAWQAAEKSAWLNAQSIKRSYEELVLSQIDVLKQRDDLKVQQYGALSYDEDRYPLFAITSANMDNSKPTVLVTGGVHGYETSGVMGALTFCFEQLAEFQSRFNFVVAPCVSPWGFETINRWNPDANDPNRSFFPDNVVEPDKALKVQESGLLQSFIRDNALQFIAHFDLHETTDSDNDEFRPALAARDAIEQKSWNIPDGYYSVGDTLRPEPEFQAAIVAAVEAVTHIAPADENGELIGATMVQKGVIEYPTKKLGLCAGMTDAKYVTTTEVYPDSPLVDDKTCAEAQVAVIKGGLQYLISQGLS